MTLKDFLRETVLPKHEARMLAQAVTGYSRTQLITRDNESVPEWQLLELQSCVARRTAGEPLAYILGWREFYGRRFGVTADTLIPRPETEHLVDAVLARLPQGGKVWDLGCGSGAIAVTVALERPDAEVYASDISAAALAVAQNNASVLGACVGFGCGSWFEAGSLCEQYGFDIVVSNPPYIEAGDAHLTRGDLRFEPQSALTDFADGLTCFRALAAGAAEYLKPNGWFLVEHGFQQGAAVRAIFRQAGFLQVHTLLDLAGLDRITLGTKT